MIIYKITVNLHIFKNWPIEWVAMNILLPNPRLQLRALMEINISDIMINIIKYECNHYVY